MKLRLLALGLVLCGTAHAAVIVPDAGSHWKAIADRLFSTVIQVRGIEAQQTVAYGSGVLIGNGLAVTTLHAVAVPSGRKLVPLQEVQVLVSDGGALDAQVIEALPELDLALLLLSDKGATLRGASLATEVPVEGDLLVAMGAGDDAISVVGVVVSRVDGDLFTLASKRMIDSRFWGGPLFNEQGRLAGIHLTSMVGSKAVSARVIQGMLDRRGVSRHSPEAR